MRRLLASAVLVVALAGAAFAPLASADPVVVINAGDGSKCISNGVFGGDYAGTSTIVFDSDGIRLTQCHARLVAGTPISEIYMVIDANCAMVITPGGILNVVCRN
jgi:opacity protein-like surface antigen